MPYELPFIAVTEAAFTQLVNEQYAVLRRALAAHERLERIVLSERGLEALVGTLSNSDRREPCSSSTAAASRSSRRVPPRLDADAVAALRTELHERAARREGGRSCPRLAEEGDRGLALPVAADEGAARRKRDDARAPEAWLVAAKDVGPLSDFDRLTLHQAVTIVALELLRGGSPTTPSAASAGDVLAAVVSGELSGAELTRRLEPFGLAERVAAIVVEPAQATGDGRLPASRPRSSAGAAR